MISVGVRKDDLARELNDSIKRNTILGQLLRRDEVGFVSEKFGALLSVSLEIGCHNSLETFCMGLRDGVPEFRGSKVEMIDRIEICIFYVP